LPQVGANFKQSFERYVDVSQPPILSETTADIGSPSLIYSSLVNHQVSRVPLWMSRVEKTPKSSSSVLMRTQPTLWTGLPSMLEPETLLGGSLSPPERVLPSSVVSPTTPVSYTRNEPTTKLMTLDGMTSLSVRQYILGVMKAHGLSERDVTKFQTGGPDGDLGSSKLIDAKSQVWS